MSEINNKDFMLKRAQNAVMSRDFVLAARLYKNILREDPDNLEIMLELASSYVRASEDEKALSVYRNIVEKDPSNFNALNSLGGIYRRLGRYEDSIAVLERALTTGKNPNAVYYNMGHTYKLMGRYEDAADCFVTVIEENPSDVLAYNHLGSIQAARGDHVKALQTYNKGLQIDKNHPILHYNAALSYLALNKQKEAKMAFENALRTKPGWIEAMVAYADLLMGMKKTKEAQDILSQAQRLTPEDFQVLNSLGKLHIRLKDYVSAEQNFKDVLTKDTDNYAALCGLAEVYEKQRKLRDAEHLFAKVESFDRDNIDALLQHARVLLKLNELQKAYIRLNKICHTDPKNCDALNLLAQYFIRKGDEGKKQGCFKRIHDTEPSYLKHFLDCAEIYIDNGNFAKAEELITQYLKKYRNDIDALLMLGSLYEAADKPQKALQVYRRALEFAPQNTSIMEAINRLGQLIPYSNEEEEIPEYLTNNNMEEEEEVEDESSTEVLDNEDLIFNLDSTETDPEIDEAPLDLLVDDEEPIDFANFEDEEELLPKEDELVDLDEPLDANPMMEDDPLFDDYSVPTNEQLAPQEDQEYMDVANESGELSFDDDDDFSDEKPTDMSQPELEDDLDDFTYEQPQQPKQNPVDNSQYQPQSPAPQPQQPQYQQQPYQMPADTAIPNTAYQEENLYAEEDNKPIEDAVKEEEMSLPPVEPEELEKETFELPLDAEADANNPEKARINEPEEDKFEEFRAPQSIIPAPEEKYNFEELLQSLKNAAIEKKYKKTTTLFNVLDDMCSYLPSSTKDDYLSSLEKLKLEYLRHKLSGKPGLLAVAEALRNKGFVIGSSMDSEVEVSPKTIKNTLVYMKSLIDILTDKSISSILDEKIDHIIRMILD